MAENGYARNVAGDEVALWRLAVELQQQRIVSGFRAPADLLSATPAQADLRMYAVALRNLIRAVDLAARVYPEHRKQLQRARSRFGQQVHRARRA